MTTEGPNETRPIEVQGHRAAEVRAPIEVPVAYATIQPLVWKHDEQVRRSLRFVTVDANLAVAETVSVVLASSADPESSDPEDDRGMVFIDVEPLDALVLADELRRAAEESVVPCRCGRTLANMRDYSDTCLLPEQQAK